MNDTKYTPPSREEIHARLQQASMPRLIFIYIVVKVVKWLQRNAKAEAK